MAFGLSEELLCLLISVICMLGSEASTPYGAKQYPACYTDGENVYYNNHQSYGCKHPLYTTCDNHYLCCGPNHYCCYSQLYNGVSYLSCCRRNPWTVYEVVGLVTGIISWLCILTVLIACLGPQGYHRAKLLFRRKDSKIQPEHEVTAVGHKFLTK